MSKNDLLSLKVKLEKLEEKHLKIYEKNKRKSLVICGQLTKTYPSMFLVIQDKTNEKHSYRYVDVLTKQITIEFDGKELNKEFDRE